MTVSSRLGVAADNGLVTDLRGEEMNLPVQRRSVLAALMVAAVALLCLAPAMATSAKAQSSVKIVPRLSRCIQDAYHGKVYVFIHVRNSGPRTHYKKDNVRAIWKRAYESGVKDSWLNSVTLEADIPGYHGFTFRGSFGADGKKLIIACWLRYDGSGQRIRLIQ
jgi:hypothetical protein